MSNTIPLSFGVAADEEPSASLSGANRLEVEAIAERKRRMQGRLSGREVV